MFFGIEDGIGVYLLEGSCIRFRVVRKKVRGIKAAKLVDFLLRKRMSLLGDAEEKRLVTLVSDCLLKSQTCVDGFEPVKRASLYRDREHESRLRCVVGEGKPLAGSHC